MHTKRTLFLLGAAALIVAVTPGCDQGDFLMGRRDTAPEQVIENTPEKAIYHPLIKVDGDPNDWRGLRPLWEEAGDIVGDPGFSVDVKQVYLANDSQYLYIYVRHLPDVNKRFKNQPFVGRFGDMYFDVDNDRNTGTTNAELETFGYPNGYEKGLALEIGIMNDEGDGRFPFVSHILKQLDRKGVEQALKKLSRNIAASNPIMRQIIRRHLLWKRIEEGCAVSYDEKPHIAYGPEGTEIALAMNALEILPETTIRVLLSEEANDFTLNGLSTRYYTVWTDRDVEEYTEFRKQPGEAIFRDAKTSPKPTKEDLGGEIIPRPAHP